MRERFRGQFAPSAEVFDAMWAGALIVLDTNTLLNLYRYTPATRDTLLALLEQLRDRIWLPNQVASEFLARRLDVMESQNNAFANIEKKVTQSLATVSGELNRFKRHPTLDHASLTEVLNRSFSEFKNLLAAASQRHASSLPLDPGADAVAARVADLYEGKVGEKYSPEILKSLYEAGDLRYAEEIPPGYKDLSKGEPGKYGDWILWKQLLDHVKAEPRDVLLVTDDGKEDWWSQRAGQTIGPRPELIDEFFEACGHRVHLYTPEQFMRLSSTKLAADVSQGSIDEIEAVSATNTNRAQRKELMSLRRSLISERRREYTNLQWLEEQAEAQVELRRLSSLRRDLENKRDAIKRALDGVDSGDAFLNGDAHYDKESIDSYRHDLIAEFNDVKRDLIGLSRDSAALESHGQVSERSYRDMLTATDDVRDRINDLESEIASVEELITNLQFE